MNAATHLGQRCTAHSSRTGEPCKRQASLGSRVCRSHGAAAPQVKAAALDRLRALQHPAIDRIAQLIESGDSEHAALSAAFGILDRTGLKPTDKLELTGADGGALKTEEVRMTVEEQAVRLKEVFDGARERMGLGPLNWLDPDGARGGG